MRVPVKLDTNTSTRKTLHNHIQAGGQLPHYVQGGTGFFGSLMGGLKRIAIPVLKSVGKAALPMAQEALTTAINTKGPLKNRLKAAAQNSVTKQNLLQIGKAGVAAARPIL